MLQLRLGVVAVSEYQGLQLMHIPADIEWKSLAFLHRRFGDTTLVLEGCDSQLPDILKEPTIET